MIEENRILPADPLAFIRECVREDRLILTWHVNIRMTGRSISLEKIMEAASTYEIIECYPEDKYFPSYLVYACCGQRVLHVLFGADVPNRNVRLITVYDPEENEWDGDLKRRKRP
jgi:hypothetical protein